MSVVQLLEKENKNLKEKKKDYFMETCRFLNKYIIYFLNLRLIYHIYSIPILYIFWNIFFFTTLFAFLTILSLSNYQNLSFTKSIFSPIKLLKKMSVQKLLLLKP